MSVGERIKDARQSLGRRRGARLTQQWLADKVGVPKGTVAKWETDVQEPKGENLVAVARALEVDPRELLGTMAGYQPDGDDAAALGAHPNPARTRAQQEEAASRRQGARKPSALVRQIDEINRLDIGEWHRTLRIDALAASYRARAMEVAERARQREAEAAAARARAFEAAEKASHARALAAAGKIPELPEPMEKLGRKPAADLLAEGEPEDQQRGRMARITQDPLWEKTETG